LVRPIYLTNQLMDGTVALLEAAREEACERFVYISSSMVYGNFLADEIDEEHPCEPVELYGSMKLGCERVVRLYTRHFGLDHTIVRPTAVYGPTGNEGFVITKFISAAINSGVIKVFGDEVRLDFTYVDDAARGIVLATTSKNGINQTFNIARGESTRILDAARHIQKLAPGVEIILERKDPLYPRRGTLDISKAGRLLDFKPEFSLEDGLDAFYAHAERALSTT
jgi:UDP-glucose 4-epimerase